MVPALLILVIFLFVVWLVFLLKLLKFSPAREFYPRSTSLRAADDRDSLRDILSTDPHPIQHTVQPEFSIGTSGLRTVYFSSMSYNEQHLSKPERETWRSGRLVLIFGLVGK